MEFIGKRVKARRVKLGLTQSKVALACGITQQAYEKLENGEVRRPRYVLELADVLQASAKWLLTGEDGATLPPLIHERSGIAVFKYNTHGKCAIQWESDAPIEWADSFPGLDNKSGYSAGLHIQGDGLEPVYRHGYTVFINRRKHPRKEGHCVFEYGKDIHVGKYLKHDNNNYYFSCLKSKDKMKILQNKVGGIYMIVGVLYN
jgi:transcriptional regulator with XRE-family HTH domain